MYGNQSTFNGTYNKAGTINGKSYYSKPIDYDGYNTAYVFFEPKGGTLGIPEDFWILSLELGIIENEESGELAVGVVQSSANEPPSFDQWIGL